MKWSFVGLLLLGVIAAVCAAVLVGSLRATGRGPVTPEDQQPDKFEIVIAAEALPASAVVDANSILLKNVPRGEVSPECLSSPNAVLGKVLSVSMVEGQPFTARCFVTEGTGRQLAGILPKGMRAVTLPLTRHSGLEGLLYPGCVVDVLTSFKVSAGKGKLRQAISTVLIEGVQVLAIENRTVVSGETDDASADSSRAGLGRRRNVTLLVNPRQAQALQLAVEHGSVSLAMRSPLDTSPARRKPTLLSDISDELVARSKTRRASTGRPAGARLPAPATGVPMVPGFRPVLSPGATTRPSPPAPPVLVEPVPGEDNDPADRWVTLVIRGGKSKKESFPVD